VTVRIALRERLLPLIVTGGAAAAAPGVLIAVVGGRHVAVEGWVHFYAVGLTAVATAAAAVALTIVGARSGDARTVLVGTAFGVMGALLGLHGLATPGYFAGSMGVVTITGGATLPAGAAILALSVVPLPRPLRGVKPLLVLEGALLTVVLGLGASALAFPDLLPRVPEANSRLALCVLALGLGLFAVLAIRAFRTFLLTRRVADLLVTVGIVWLSTSLVAALTTTYAQLGWWLGHGLELDGILVVGIPVALDLARSAQSRPLAGDLGAAELVLAEERLLGSHVRALTVVLAERDGMTEQHTRRVAMWAVQVGEELGLSARSLRTLAIGGLIHDLGKLAIPDSILQKPGRLDEDEYAAIKRHPELGARLLDEIGGFPPAVRRLILDHHERPDGLGYPRGLRDAEINLETRVITVCDVYDALISTRVYREAWRHEDAMELLHDRAAFDARCVAALEAVLRRELGIARPAAPEQLRRTAAVSATIAV
jgi:HD-GYP domain-containing protein (c-di-GMP phosphodiesterase class II)